MICFRLWTTSMLMHEGVADMHCMSDEYLVQELEDEMKGKPSIPPTA